VECQIDNAASIGHLFNGGISVAIVAQHRKG
jgi:hypothetical protein